MSSTGSAIEALIFDAYGTLFDTHSVMTTLETDFPGRGEYLTQVWRLKQLEYSWLRALSEDYQDFGVVTRDALRYSLGTIGIEAHAAQIERLARAYDRLTIYPDTVPALEALAGRRLAVFSNGSREMLDELLSGAGIAELFEEVISVDAVRTFKPSPRAYRLACDTLQLAPQNVMLVSSNGFDIRGATLCGLKTARIERVSAAALQDHLVPGKAFGPAVLFHALRTQLEGFGSEPDVTVASLLDLQDAIAPV